MVDEVVSCDILLCLLYVIEFDDFGYVVYGVVVCKFVVVENVVCYVFIVVEVVDWLVKVEVEII